VRSNASENSQISPSTTVRAARVDGSRPNVASVLQEGRKNPSIHASTGAIWGIPVDRAPISRKSQLFQKFKEWFSPARAWGTVYEPAATADDIFYCFRLILGRNPNRQEWAGHSSHVGEDLNSVVASYLSSLEFSLRKLNEPQAGLAPALSKFDGFQIYSDASDMSVGHIVRSGSYEPEVNAVFRRFIKPGMAVIDIGANIGFYTMLSASIVGPTGYVLAVEPNGKNIRLLEASRRLNGFDWVTVAQVAAGRDTGILMLNASYSNGTTSRLLDDVGHMVFCETVPSVQVDALISRRIDFVKIDVEGAEYNALLGMKRVIEESHPIIVSEFSPDFMPGISGIDGEGYLRWILERGYEIFVVEPDGSLSPSNSDCAFVMRKYRERGTDHIDIVATT
jgi:FkbM family methyltransferase